MKATGPLPVTDTLWNDQPSQLCSRTRLDASLTVKQKPRITNSFCGISSISIKRPDSCDDYSELTGQTFFMGTKL